MIIALIISWFSSWVNCLGCQQMRWDGGWGHPRGRLAITHLVKESVNLHNPNPISFLKPRFKFTFFFFLHPLYIFNSIYRFRMTNFLKKRKQLGTLKNRISHIYSWQGKLWSFFFWRQYTYLVALAHELIHLLNVFFTYTWSKETTATTLTKLGFD